MSVDFVNLSMTRRKLIKGAACSAAAASAPSLVNHAFAEQIAKLEKEGWSKHPVACTMCGAYCGILAMRKEGEPISEKTVRIFPNPDILSKVTAAVLPARCGSGTTLSVFANP